MVMKRFLFFSSVAVAVTSQPSNESELQLYRVLQRANLLSYYDTFIAQGGSKKAGSLEKASKYLYSSTKNSLPLL